MADKSLDVLIRIIAEEVGPEKAEEILQRIKTESKSLNEEDVKGTEKSISSKHALHAALHLLGREFSELRRLSSLLFNPGTIAVGGLLIAIQLITRSIQTAHENTQRWLDLLKDGIDTTGLRSAQRSIAEQALTAKVAAEGFAQSIQNIIAAEQTLASRTAAATAALDRQATAEEQLAAAKKKTAEAEIRAGVATGKISKEQEIESLAALEDKSAEDTLLRRRKLREGIIEELRREQQDTIAAAKVAAEKTAEVEKQAAVANEQPTRYTSLIEQTKKDLEAVKKQIEGARKVLDEVPILSLNTENQQSRNSARSILNTAPTLQQQLEARLKKLDTPEAKVSFESKAAQATDVARKAEAEQTRLNERIKELEAEVAAKIAEHNDLTRSESAVSEEERRARTVEARTQEAQARKEAAERKRLDEEKRQREIQQQKEEQQRQSNKSVDDLRHGRPISASGVSIPSSTLAVEDLGVQITKLVATLEQVAKQSSTKIIAANGRIQNSYLT